MRLAFVLAVAASLGACCSTASTPDSTYRSSPGAIHGRVEPRNSDPAARVQVCAVDADGLVTRAPYESVTVGADGQFATRPLSPGRYRLIYRDPAAPPSLLTVRVPSETPVVLRRATDTGLVELRALAQTPNSVHCRLTSEARIEGVADVREFICGPNVRASVRGLRPGRWRLDVIDLGATTEIELPVGSPVREVVVDPPQLAQGGSVLGQVRRLDGLGARSLLVTARPFDESRGTGERWGRYAETDSQGSYRLVGIPPGEALVRVECREVLARILPAQRVARIPPSGTVELGFIVEP